MSTSRGDAPPARVDDTAQGAPSGSHPASPAGEPLSPLDRVLGIVADVRAGEGLTALGLAAALFLLLLAYYIIKPVREALILQHPAGAEYKSWLGAGIALLLLLVVPAYAKLAERLPRNRLVSGVTLFFASHLVFFYWATSTAAMRGSLWLGVGFFLWVGVFNMLLVSQLWAFANDLYDQEQGKRLFAIVGLGASFGAIGGGVVKDLLANVFDTFEMLLVTVVALFGVVVLVEWLHRREGARARRAGHGKPEEAEKLLPGGAFALLRQHRYLGLIAAFSLVFTLVNTNGEYLLGKLIKMEAAATIEQGKLAPDEIVSFIAGKYNDFYQWMNILGFLLQLFVVSRLVKVAGIGRAFFILPVLALTNGLAVAAFPVLGMLFWGKVVENATDYSLNNTLRQMLWLPTTREMKYKAKQAVDTFFVRMGDVASGAWVALGISALGLGVRAFAFSNAILVGIWLWLAFAIVRERRVMDAPAQSQGSSAPEGQAS